jgi:hypothetical protein
MLICGDKDTKKIDIEEWITEKIQKNGPALTSYNVFTVKI